MIRGIAFLSGLVFGLGLCLGGMTQPSKVIAFLDVGGAWDPALMLVMAGAVVTYFVLSRRIERRRGTVSGRGFVAPEPPVDRPLLLGAATFGVGWGLSGVCPGPAVVAASVAGPALWVVLLGMFAGFALARPPTAGCGSD